MSNKVFGMQEGWMDNSWLYTTYYIDPCYSQDQKQRYKYARHLCTPTWGSSLAGSVDLPSSEILSSFSWGGSCWTTFRHSCTIWFSIEANDPFLLKCPCCDLILVFDPSTLSDLRFPATPDLLTELLRELWDVSITLGSAISGSASLDLTSALNDLVSLLALTGVSLLALLGVLLPAFLGVTGLPWFLSDNMFS